jgi:2',3'-cyclic-nucleotide 2'-phosphodiesterase (5'-nucleotidase family)
MNRIFHLVAPVVCLLSVSAFAAEDVVVKVYHTNDVHGWIMSRPDKLIPGRALGGAAALKALIDKETGPKLVLDAGDWWQGTPEGSLSKGQSVAEVFNAVGYDAIEVGNHEFDAGLAPLLALIASMKAPVLAANIYGADGKHVPWTQPHIVKDVAGIKFGIFGLLTVHMDKLAFPKNIEGLTFRREVDEAKDQVAALRKEGAQVIIAVTHVGYEESDKVKFEGDQTIAREVDGIDLLVGGHSHTSLSHAWRDPAHGTLVVQAGSYLAKAGRTTLKIDASTHRVREASDELLELWPDRVGENAAVKAVVAKQEEKVGEAFKVVIATASAPLDRGAPEKESGLGSWMADCYRSNTGADVALQNGGGMRADIAAGPVTLRTIFSVMPFDNTLVKLKLKGALLRSILDHGMGWGRIAQVSGAVLEFRHSSPKGARLVSASVAGAALDDAKTYNVTALDFIVMGGDGFNDFDKAETSEPTGVLARDVLRDCAQKQGTIAPPTPGRLKAMER